LWAAKALTNFLSLSRKMMSSRKRNPRQTTILSLVYFIRRESDNAIKIGTTVDLAKRADSLAKAYGALQMLGVHSGGYEKEKELHAQFRHLRIAREWFTEDEVLLSYIRDYTSLPKMNLEIQPKSERRYKSNVWHLVLKKGIRDNWLYRPSQISKATGVSPMVLSRLINDTGYVERLSLEAAIALSDWLECDVRDLYSPIEQVQPSKN
jgi:hypothetical protein